MKNRVDSGSLIKVFLLGLTGFFRGRVKTTCTRDYHVKDEPVTCRWRANLDHLKIRPCGLNLTCPVVCWNNLKVRSAHSLQPPHGKLTRGYGGHYTQWGRGKKHEEGFNFSLGFGSVEFIIQLGNGTGSDCMHSQCTSGVSLPPGREIAL